jgi:hypothetical protein
MKIQIVSDLHLEFGPLELPVEGADVLIAAGDIALGLEGFQWLEQFSIPVIYVAGNHEYWGQDLAGLTAALADRSGAGDIHFLENRAVVLDGVRFLGCTLWTDFNACDEAAMDELRFIMNDFRYVTRGGRLMRPDDLVELNLASRAWLAETLASPYEGKKEGIAKITELSDKVTPFPTPPLHAGQEGLTRPDLQATGICANLARFIGEVSERSKEHAWKVCIG